MTQELRENAHQGKMFPFKRAPVPILRLCWCFKRKRVVVNPLPLSLVVFSAERAARPFSFFFFSVFFVPFRSFLSFLPWRVAMHPASPSKRIWHYRTGFSSGLPSHSRVAIQFSRVNSPLPPSPSSRAPGARPVYARLRAKMNEEEEDRERESFE